MSKILVTGGAGYIGSHTCVELAAVDYDYLIVDNFSNSKNQVLERLKSITNKNVECAEADIRDDSALNDIFSQHDISAVIHFAGLKAVGESCKLPVKYYENNIYGTLNLLKVMAEHNIKNIIFSSSATVYGDPASVPITESFPTSTTNPYGYSKLVVENIIKDLCVAEPDWNATMLRYFNPVGAHKSGMIGEDPNGIPNNLLPYITQVAIGKLKELSVFGDDYPTKDGTGVRDYIHVVDLAKGHIYALNDLLSKNSENQNYQVFNLGTGNGYSVLEVVKAFEQASGMTIPYNISPRRPGDVAECYADTTLAREQLQWQSRYELKDMMEDSWRWQSSNPNGYE